MQPNTHKTTPNNNKQTKKRKAHTKKCQIQSTTPNNLHETISRTTTLEHQLQKQNNLATHQKSGTQPNTPS